MATVDPIETAPPRTPAWLAYYECPNFLPDTKALSSALTAYIKSMDAVLYTLSKEGAVDETSARQFAFDAYNMTQDMEAFFNEWKAAEQGTHEELDDKGPPSTMTVECLKRKIMSATALSLPAPKGAIIAKAFCSVIEGDFDDAAKALDSLIGGAS